MSSLFFKYLYTIIILLVVLVLFISIFFIPTMSNVISFEKNYYEDFDISNSGFVWPIPGYTTITSYFGKRNSPTQGASSFHKGIDIGAPENTKLIAVIDGIITYTGFLGGGGYTITLSNGDMKITYCHVSPNYIVK